LGAGRPLGSSFLCEECAELLRPLQQELCCRRCGVFPLHTDGAPVGKCQECADLPESFTEARSAFPYSSPAGAVVRAIKYRRQEFLAEHLAALATPVLGEWLSRAGETLIPAPMTTLRELGRGYNQATVIAESLGRRTGQPVMEEALRRIRQGAPQARHHLRADRHANLKGAFSADPKRIAGKRLVLVDDVMTTGATAAHAALALRDAGAASVAIVTICRAHLAMDANELRVEPFA
jgi:ComF family protein